MLKILILFSVPNTLVITPFPWIASVDFLDFVVANLSKEAMAAIFGPGSILVAKNRRMLSRLLSEKIVTSTTKRGLKKDKYFFDKRIK